MKIKKSKVTKLIAANERISLPEFPVNMLSWIEPATKGGLHITLIADGKAIGQVQKGSMMGGAYRFYIKSSKGAGEHRFDKQQAKELELSF